MRLNARQVFREGTPLDRRVFLSGVARIGDRTAELRDREQLAPALAKTFAVTLKHLLAVGAVAAERELIDGGTA